MNRVSILNFPISVGKYDMFVQEIMQSATLRVSKYVCVANVHMFTEAFKNKSFMDVVNNADIITPDGQPIAWAVRLLHGVKQPRVAGMDLLPTLLEKAQFVGLTVFVYGGSEELLGQAKKYLNEKYPALKVVGMYSPPFRSLSVTEEDQMVADISAAAPHLIFAVLGCPKQEKWMASMKGRLNSVMIGIGGALPVMVGLQKRAPKWMQDASLEWLFRLSLEPRRLFKRYAVTNSVFLYLIIKEVIKKGSARLNF